MTWKRIATAAVLIPAVVLLVLFASTAWVAMGLALVMLLALFEYFSLGAAIGHRGYQFWTAACALFLVYVQWLLGVERQYQLAGDLLLRRPFFRFTGGLASIPGVFFLFILGLAILILWAKRPVSEALPDAGISCSGLLLVAFPLAFAVRLHASGALGPYLLLFALVITWAGDSAAYFAGRTLGKHPLAPHISPNKTWEGTIAGFAGALLTGYLFSRWLNIPLPHLLAMAALGNIAGQMGDLLESAYKRSAGVKDSGGLLPGHGGMLDRIDALILTIPVVWYYWTSIYPLGS